jgi:formylmethanofuran dehydrogenase subunit E
MLNLTTMPDFKNDLPPKALLDDLLQESAARHQHLCPRQVLGVRLGLLGLRELGLVEEACPVPFQNQDKRLLTIVETDGCGADGIAVAADCAIGRRTLRVMDYGKVAATLVDTVDGRAVRLAPHPQARERAAAYAPEAAGRWQAYLAGYQLVPDHELFQVRPVQLTKSLAEILSMPDKRVVCDHCGEEIINQREIIQDNQTLCVSCAGDGYYWQSRLTKSS